jgi:hypothetical protein
MRDGYLSR